MNIRLSRGALVALIVGALGSNLKLAAGEVDPEPRSIDGGGNNLNQPNWGQTNTQLKRAAPAMYGDGVATLGGETRPNPRVVSNDIFTQDTMLNSVFIPDPRGLTDFVWAWGQFVAHDTDFTPDDSSQFAAIPIPPGDFWFDPDGDAFAFFPFRRSVFDPATGTDATNPREQVNVISTWIDASGVYGSDPTRAAWLRTFVGGRMKTSRSAFGPLLPFNDGSQANTFGNTTDFFVAGDVRSNVHLTLQSLHTLMVREHNRLADSVAGEHPNWTDEQVYQRVRRIVGAEMQAITYNEYLPTMMGGDVIGPYEGYDPSVDPSLSNVFATAAFRMGHSQVGTVFLRLGADGDPIPQGNIEVLNGYFHPELIVNEGGIEPVLRGLAAGQEQKTDARMVDDMRNFLFNAPGMGEPAALDLAAINIQRGRDHGLADYNSVREAFGLERKTSFDAISSDPKVAGALEATYGNVDDIDAWVGMLAEDLLNGSSVSETVQVILIDQFRRLRSADRFWYENDPELADLLPWLEQLTLRELIMNNTPIGPDEIQPNVFQLPCEPDLTGDGMVNGADLAALLIQWGSAGGASTADLNGDGVVNGSDLALLLSNWGECY